MTELKEQSAHVMRRLPGHAGVWVFAFADMCFFAFFFAAYAYEQSRQPALFFQSQGLLDPVLGMLNTIVLLTSSWLVVLGVHAARGGSPKAALLVKLAIAFGGVFVISKFFEYRAKLAAGVSMLSNDFFMYYFTMTGIHLLHLLGGLVVLSLAARRIRRGVNRVGEVRFLESAATYWHMVDLLWVMILALLYQGAWRWQ